MRHSLGILTATAALAWSVLPLPPVHAQGAAQLPPDAIMADQLDDLTVRNAANERLGEIEDVVLSQGRVVGYIVSVDGASGERDRDVLVDPASVTVTYDAGARTLTAVMDTTREQLRAMPQFTYEARWRD